MNNPRFSRNQQKLYSIAITNGITNPLPTYIGGCWYVMGDNVNSEDCIGFSIPEAIDNLQAMRFVHGGEISLAQKGGPPTAGNSQDLLKPFSQ